MCPTITHSCPADGIAGLYRGFVISCVGIVVYRGLYFGLYDSLKPALGSYSDNFAATFVLGWGITNLAGECGYECDGVVGGCLHTSVDTCRGFMLWWWYFSGALPRAPI